MVPERAVDLRNERFEGTELRARQAVRPQLGPTHQDPVRHREHAPQRPGGECGNDLARLGIDPHEVLVALCPELVGEIAGDVEHAVGPEGEVVHQPAPTSEPREGDAARRVAGGWIERSDPGRRRPLTAARCQQVTERPSDPQVPARRCDRAHLPVDHVGCVGMVRGWRLSRGRGERDDRCGDRDGTDDSRPRQGRDPT